MNSAPRDDVPLTEVQCFVCDLMASANTFVNGINKIDCSACDATENGLEKTFSRYLDTHNSRTSSCKSVMTLLRKISTFSTPGDDLAVAIISICAAFGISGEDCSVAEEHAEAFLQSVLFSAQNRFCDKEKIDFSIKNSLSLRGEFSDQEGDAIFCGICTLVMSQIVKLVETGLIDLAGILDMVKGFCVQYMGDEAKTCTTVLMQAMEQIKNGAKAYASAELCQLITAC